LHNSAKYSGAKHIDVEFWATPNEVRLTVSDSGEGFDLKAAREGLAWIIHDFAGGKRKGALKD